MTSRRNSAIVSILIFGFSILLIAPFIGIESISPAEIAGDPVKESIFWKIRVPRVLMAFVAGAALALSGMAFQAMFRNSLATPFTLGVASGASLGAVMYMSLGFSFSVLGLSGVSISAFAGAILSIALVYGLTMLRQGFSVGTMLLAGVAVSFFFSSVIMFMQYVSDFTGSFTILRWLMGRLDIIGFGQLVNSLPFVISGSVIVIYFARELDLLATGEGLAVSRGVDAPKVKGAIFLGSSLMVGGVVSVCGPIGFVGMVSPHIVRLMVGSDHRTLAFVTPVFGGAFLTLCDTVARVLIAPVELPVGVITALVGGPFFLWLLVAKPEGKIAE